jgi:hypothetical protein
VKTDKNELAPEVPCPTCGAKPGKRCTTTIGLLRNGPHLNRRLEAKEKLQGYFSRRVPQSRRRETEFGEICGRIEKALSRKLTPDELKLVALSRRIIQDFPTERRAANQAVVHDRRKGASESSG